MQFVGVPGGLRLPRFRTMIFLLFSCFVVCLLCSSCIAPVPMTKRVSAAASSPEQKKIDLTFVQPGKTSRSEVSQKLAWADSGIKDDHLFLARWASSSSGWVWRGADIARNTSAEEGAFRDWTVHNFLVDFDDAGVVENARDVANPELLTNLQQRVAQSNGPALDLSSPIELRVFLDRIASPVPSAMLLLSADSFGFQDRRKPKRNFHTHPSRIKGVIPWVDPKEAHSPVSNSIGVTILFKEKTPAGKQISFNLPAPDLLVLIKYLHLAEGLLHAL